MLKSISEFYVKWEGLGLRVTFVLVSLQVIHLFWLSTFVILNAPELTLYIPPILFVVIDYIEIPSLIAGIIFYITQLKYSKKSVIYISLLGIQFVHILWITDAFIYMSFKFNEMTYLAWMAVFIDFLELAVVVDLYKRIRNR